MGDQQDNTSLDGASVQGDQDQILPEIQVGDSSGGQDPAAPQVQAVNDDQTVPTSRSLVVTPDEASDTDLIEKEWVVKAKQIVEHTASDPFLQQEEIGKMKADYMKKRYNKDLGTA